MATLADDVNDMSSQSSCTNSEKVLDTSKNQSYDIPLLEDEDPDAIESDKSTPPHAAQ